MPKKSQTSPENRAKVISCFTNRKSLTQEDIIGQLILVVQQL